MTHAFDIRTEDMPAAMRVLLDEYPRDSWDAHPGFKEKTKHWLGAHQMFRKLGELVRSETELYLDRSREPDDFAGRLSYYGNALVANLHGHHNWEDKSCFPELSAADPRFDRGLEILEMDHQELDRVLDQFTETANRSIKLIHLDEPQAREEAGRLQALAGTIEAFLDRHLADEEELAVPIILHHRLRG